MNIAELKPTFDYHSVKAGDIILNNETNHRTVVIGSVYDFLLDGATLCPVGNILAYKVGDSPIGTFGIISKEKWQPQKNQFLRKGRDPELARDLLISAKKCIDYTYGSEEGGIWEHFDVHKVSESIDSLLEDL